MPANKPQEGNQSYRTITTKHPATCKRCGQTIPVGTKVRYGGSDLIYHYKDQCPRSDSGKDSPGRTAGVQTTGEPIAIPVRLESWLWLLELADMGLERYKSLSSGVDSAKVEFGNRLLTYLRNQLSRYKS